MASVIMMRNPRTGIIRKGFIGFSWTTLFFGGFPALFRGDILTGLLVLLANFLTGGLAGLVWAFFYNKRYTLDLIEEGYRFDCSPEMRMYLNGRLGIAYADPCAPMPQDGNGNC